MSAPLELSDKTFGALTVLSRSSSTPAGKSTWWCRCKCGSRCVVVGRHLMSGHTRSCGCEGSRATLGVRLTVHGQCSGKKSREYNTWNMMMDRCFNRNNKKWDRYGGRGITVCEDWRIAANFLRDVGLRPPGTSLDRYPNNDGNYEPGNVRWATPRQQASNRSPRRWQRRPEGA